MYGFFRSNGNTVYTPFNGNVLFLSRAIGNGFPPGKLAHGSSIDGLFTTMLAPFGAVSRFPPYWCMCGKSKKIPYAARITVRPSPFGSHKSNAGPDAFPVIRLPRIGVRNSTFTLEINAGRRVGIYGADNPLIESLPVEERSIPGRVIRRTIGFPSHTAVQCEM